MLWLRLYTEITRDRKLRRHPPFVRWCWIAILVIARQSPQPGKLLLSDNVSVTLHDITDEALLTLHEVEQSIKAFAEQGMLTQNEEGIYEVVNFTKRQPTSDTTGAERVRKHREKCKNVTEVKRYSNALDTDTDTDTDIKENIKEKIPFAEIIDYLNQVCGTKYRVGESHKKHISARFAQKYTFDDFKTVIDKKAREWLGTDRAIYLRPETLFGSKFDTYLNQPDAPNRNNPKQAPLRRGLPDL